MKTILSPKVKAAITRFQQAAERHAVKGSLDIEDRHAAVHQLEEARKGLEDAIARFAAGHGV